LALDRYDKYCPDAPGGAARSTGQRCFCDAGLGVQLEGVTTVPNEPVQYGPWAGKIVTGRVGTEPQNNSLERTRPARDFRSILALPGRSARGHWAYF
jgi:hypothetical protein